MPRTRKLRFAECQAEGVQPMLVASVVPEGEGWRISLVQVAGKNWGRKHALALPLDPPSDGAWADFFRACGIPVEQGGEVEPTQAEGKIVNAVFHLSDGKAVIVGFGPTSEETTDDSSA